MTKKYQWHYDKPDVLNVHSSAKHRVLRAYLKKYIHILSSNPRMPKLDLHIIDGFCGGGRYQDERTRQICDGSPLILLDAVQEAEKEINKTRKNPFHVNARFYFIDKDPDAISCLKQVLKDRGYTDQEKVNYTHGAFLEEVDALLKRITRDGQHVHARALFFLDQCGYSSVPFYALQKILRTLHNAEIILNFAIDYFLTYFNPGEKYKKITTDLGIGNRDFEQLCEHLQKGKAEAKFLLQCNVARLMFEKSMARYMTRFFIHSREDRRDYWLVHLSNHDRAHEVMLSIHWDLKNTFSHYGKPGLNVFPELIGYNPDKDITLMGEQLFDFGDDARLMSKHALLQQLPILVHTQNQPVSFSDIRRMTALNTPASVDIYKEVFIELAHYGELSIQTPNGGRRRKANQIRANDLIIPSSQISFLIP